MDVMDGIIVQVSQPVLTPEQRLRRLRGLGDQCLWQPLLRFLPDGACGSDAVKPDVLC